MKINFQEKKIEVNQRELTAACHYGSDMYYKVTAIKRDYPDFDVILNVKHRPNTHAGLTFSAMEARIIEWDEDGSLIEEFMELRRLGKSYGCILGWYCTQVEYYETWRIAV